MNENEIIGALVKELSGVCVSYHGDETIVTLPFNDYADESIQAGVMVVGDEIIVDDLGRIAGLLFSLGQHTEDTAAFQLVKNLSEAYDINVDFNQGILKQKIVAPKDIHKFVDFMKVLTTLQVAIPELKQHKNKIEKSKLVSRLGHDISQLKLPVQMEKQIQVFGKNEVWPVTFKYERKEPNKKEILILTADLGIKDPRQKAASIVASAMDLMQIGNRDLRVVYEVDGIGKLLDVQRAKNLIDQNQREIRYRTFNYAEQRQRDELLALTRQDVMSLV